MLQAWQRHEVWHERSYQQQRATHKLAAVYNTIVNNRCGWSSLGFMILRNNMPAVSVIDPNASATHHAHEIGGFTKKLTEWFSVFAQSLVDY